MVWTAKASEVIEKLLKLTQEAGKDLPVIMNYHPSHDYGWGDEKPEEYSILDVNDEDDICLIIMDDEEEVICINKAW